MNEHERKKADEWGLIKTIIFRNYLKVLIAFCSCLIMKPLLYETVKKVLRN